ncbi:hypothetical protein GCM10010199_29610 [Dactylosporangium roseum]
MPQAAISDGDGVAVGWLICGVIFLAPGAGPFFPLDKEFGRSTPWADHEPPEPVGLRPVAGPPPARRPARRPSASTVGSWRYWTPARRPSRHDRSAPTRASSHPHLNASAGRTAPAS